MIYLDNSATTVVFSETAQVVQKYMTEAFYNPSSAYLPAVEAERAVNGARKYIADLFGAPPETIIFTSGGTESNNMAINGVISASKRINRPRIITTAGEHASVYETCKKYEARGYEVEYLNIKNGGAIDPLELKSLMTPSTLIVSIMHVNNETGAINDVGAAYKQMRAISQLALMHVEGSHSLLKLTKLPPCDLYTLCAHKFHGLKASARCMLKRAFALPVARAEAARKAGCVQARLTYRVLWAWTAR
jgi:cysteine desulfurase